MGPSLRPRWSTRSKNLAMPGSGSFSFFIWVRNRLPLAAQQKRAVAPPLDAGFGRQAVERVVQLDRIEVARIPLQHLRRGQFFRVERPLPMLVVPAGRADVDGHL